MTAPLPVELEALDFTPGCQAREGCAGDAAVSVAFPCRCQVLVLCRRCARLDVQAFAVGRFRGLLIFCSHCHMLATGVVCEALQ